MSTYIDNRLSKSNVTHCVTLARGPALVYTHCAMCISRGAIFILAATVFLGTFKPAPQQASHRPDTSVDSLIAAADYVSADSAAAEDLREVEAVCGADDDRLVPWLIGAGALRLDLGKWGEAEELFGRALKLASIRGRDGCEDVLAARRGISRALMGRGELAAAGDSARRCIELSREVYGAGSPECAEDLNILAEVRIEQDRLREAAGLIDEAIGLVGKGWVPDHEAFADSVEKGWGEKQELLADLLVDRANILNSTGRHNEAFPLYERALAIKEDRWGRDHPGATMPLLGIASVYNKKGEFAKAEAVYQPCFEVLERALGSAHPRVAEAAVGLSACLINLGDYEGAEGVLRRCFDATVAAYGERNARAGILMFHLADALATQGKHVESTRLFRRAAAVIEEVCGPDHALTAEALSGLAHTLRRIGKGTAAMNLYERSIRIIGRNHGSPHPNAIHYRCRLGLCLCEMGRREEGLESIERGIAEAREIYGEYSYQVAIEERHRGLALYAERRCEEAYPALKRALSTLERYFGPDHLYLSKCLKALTIVSNRLRLPPEEAYGYICRAVSIHERVGGHDQLELVHILLSKVGLEIITGRWDEAVATAAKCAETALALQEESYQVYSTTEAVILAHMPSAAAEACVSAMMAHPSMRDSLLARVFSYVFKTHGMVLDRLAERQQFLDSVDESVRVDMLWRDLVRSTQRTADLVIKGPGYRPELYREELAAAYLAEEEADRALAEAAENLRSMAPVPDNANAVSTETLARALDQRAELIHFVQFQRYPHNDLEDRWIIQLHYGAFHLTVEGADSWNLDFVDLGSRGSIDSLIFSYRRAVDAVEPGRRPSAREENEYRCVARRLYDRVWAPLMSPDDGKEQGEVQSDSGVTVFLVLESWFHLLDFNALIAPTGESVIERYRLHRLSSAADLMRLSQRSSSGTGLLAVGSPVYAVRDRSRDDVVTVGETRSSPALCPEAYRPPEPLPGAERETRTVATLFSAATGEPVTVLLGWDAKEEEVKRLLPGKRIVHFATHGFFCEENKRGGYSSAERLADPLLMSGLVLAPSDGDDGLLTAQELMCIDMSGLDWVVLSACGSGLGRLFWGEGMFGLPRAFEMAGAHTVVMTLWKIDDAAMRDIMERMYRYRLAGSSTIDAVRQAQLDRLREQRLHLNRIHPALWGGVVAEGDWR